MHINGIVMGVYRDINIIWMNLIMTSRRDVTGMMVNV